MQGARARPDRPPGGAVIFQVAGGAASARSSGRGRRRTFAGIGVDADQSYLGEHVLAERVEEGRCARSSRRCRRRRTERFTGGTNIVFDIASGGVGMGKITPDVPADLVTDRSNRIRIASGAIKNIRETVG